MSLRIDIDKVRAVLIAGVWYSVHRDSFDIDAYEFIEDGTLVAYGTKDNYITTQGYSFLTDIEGDLVRMEGPVTAIQAVQRVK